MCGINVALKMKENVISHRRGCILFQNADNPAGLCSAYFMKLRFHDGEEDNVSPLWCYQGMGIQLKEGYTLK